MHPDTQKYSDCKEQGAVNKEESRCNTRRTQE
jgi:hypothetical protein